MIYTQQINIQTLPAPGWKTSFHSKLLIKSGSGSGTPVPVMYFSPQPSGDVSRVPAINGLRFIPAEPPSYTQQSIPYMSVTNPQKGTSIPTPVVIVIPFITFHYYSINGILHSIHISKVLFPDAPRMEYLPTFTPNNHPNVGKYTIHGASGIIIVRASTD